MRINRWFAIPILFSLLAGVLAYFAIDHYVTDQAAQNVRDVLLSHRGVHLYIQETMHPEFYRAWDDGAIEMSYYAPEILSSSFMVRMIHGYYNEEREKAGLPPVYYKLASTNPRNPVNRADSQEENLLQFFRENPEESEYQEVKKIDGQAYLVFAMPFLRNEARCMVCHGQREKAPAGLQARYPGQGGFNERVGDLRAIESLRIPIGKEKHTAAIFSLAVLSGFTALTGLFLFNRKLSNSVQKKTAELSSREKTFRKLLDAADAIPFEYSPTEDTYTYVGKQFQDILGQPPSTLRSCDDWKRYVHPDDRDTRLRECKEAVLNNTDHDCRLRVIRDDGTSLVVHQKVNIVLEEGAKPLAVGFIHDITAVTRSNALQQARLTVAQAATTVGLDDLIRILLDEAETLTESAIGFFHFVEPSQKTFTLQQWSTRTLEMCQARGRGEHYPLEKAGVWADCLRTGQVVVHNEYDSLPGKQGLPEGHVPLIRELVVPVKQGDRIVALIGVGNKQVPYDNSDVESVEQISSFAIEIILRNSAEEEAKKFQQQLLQAQKVESIGRLAGGVAHDFNNMLSVILGHTELLLEQTPSDSRQSEELREIKSAAERSAAITRQLLAFARKQIARPVLLDLNAAIDSMLKMLRRLIGEDIDLVWRPQPDLPKVFMDPSQIDQILANLTTNARDAIEGVGKLAIETRCVNFDEEYCKVHAEFRPGRYVLMAFSDSGCGMSREVLQNIFEPFFSTKREGKGTGLGLATVYGIIRQNGGFINVYSEPGNGTTFKIYLPAHGNTQTVIPDLVFEVQDLTGSETILFVEDEPAILSLGGKILRGYGYHVLEARHPAEAIAVASGFNGEIDLMITDVVMPDMNGRELADYFKTVRPSMKSLYISGYTANVIVHRGILEDGIDFISKPFSPSELGGRVRTVLNDGMGEKKEAFLS